VGQKEGGGMESHVYLNVTCASICFCTWLLFNRQTWNRTQRETFRKFHNIRPPIKNLLWNFVWRPEYDKNLVQWWVFTKTMETARWMTQYVSGQ
jgi:hypothetical protein